MFIANCDFLSPKITLFYDRDERHSSIASGIVSICLLILILVLVAYLSIDFIFKKNPTSFYFHSYENDLGTFELNSNGFFHFVNFEFLEGSGLSKIDLKSYAIIGVAQKDATYISNNIPTEYDHYIYELCDKSDAGDLYNTFDSEILSYYVRSYCIKKFYNSKTKTIISNTDSSFKYPYLIHGAARSDYIDYGIYIQECQNISDYNGNYCNSPEQINQEFDYFTKYAILYKDVTVDVNNFSNPITYSFPRVSNSFNILSYTANHLNFNPLNITTHTGIILDESSVLQTTIYDYNEKIVVQDSGNGIHGSFHFWLQNTVECYDRTYKKIQDISGSIDGIIEILMLIIDVLNELVFNDFQVIYDFNKEIGKNVKKTKNFRRLISFNYKINNSKIIKDINLKNNKNNNNNNNNNNNLNHIPINSSSNIYKKSNQPNEKNSSNKTKIKTISLIDQNEFQSQTNLEKKFQKVYWFDLLCRFKLKILSNNYVNYIREKREKILSEEMFLKFYFSIKKMKDLILNNDPNSINNSLLNNYYNNSLNDINKKNSIKTYKNNLSMNPYVRSSKRSMFETNDDNELDSLDINEEDIEAYNNYQRNIAKNKNRKIVNNYIDNDYI